jgi:hypothetical protein
MQICIFALEIDLSYVLTPVNISNTDDHKEITFKSSFYSLHEITFKYLAL